MPAPVAEPAAAPAPAANTTPAPEPESAPAPAAANLDLNSLWQQILASLELPSTRMLLTQQGELVRLDNQRAVVRVAPNWAGMVQSRLPLLEQAAAKVLGQPRQVVLETGEPSQQKQPPQPAAPAPVASPEAPTNPRVHSVLSVRHSSRWRIVCAVQVHLKSSEKGAKLAIDGPMPYGRTLNRHK